MSSELDENNSYSQIKRLSDEELKALWETYFADKTNKVIRDKLIVQYIYLTRYVIGRVKVNLPPSFSIEDKKRIPYDVVLTQKGMELATTFRKEKIADFTVTLTQWLPIVISAAQLYFQINPIA